MSKRPKLVNTKKAGGSDLGNQRARISNGMVILTVCLSVCMCEYVLASKNVRSCLPAFLSTGGGVSLFRGRYCIDKLGVFHANQISMCLDPHLK